MSNVTEKNFAPLNANRGLSDVIVDIVETGTTLKENDLTVIEEFMPISARFIANKASYKFKYAQLTELLNKMKEALAK